MQPVMISPCPKQTQGQMHLLSKQKDQRICPCLFHLFIRIKSYKVNVFISLFPFFRKSEKERKSRPN